MEENKDADVDNEVDGIVECYSSADVSKLRKISLEILDSIISQMEVTWDDFHQMDFSSFLGPTKFENYKDNFPQSVTNALLANYPFFDLERLSSELKYFYHSPDKYKKPQELFKYIVHNKLGTCLLELTKLLELILTIPVKSEAGVP